MRANTNKPDLNEFGKIENNYTLDEVVNDAGNVNVREIIDNTDFFSHWEKIDFSPIIGQRLFSKKILSGQHVDGRKTVVYECTIDNVHEIPHQLMEQVKINRSGKDLKHADKFRQGEVLEVTYSEIFKPFEGRTPSSGVKKTPIQEFINTARTYNWSADLIQSLITEGMSDDDREQIENYIKTLKS